MLNKPRLLTPGPTPLPETVKLALARDMIHHRKADFQAVMRDTQEKLKQLFGVNGPVLPLACSGTGAMTAAACSLFEPGEKVMVLEAGKFGERWREIAQSRGLEAASIQIPWGEAASPELVRQALERDKDIKGVFMQLSETSTGVLQPTREISLAMADSDALLVVDGISAVGISPCPMDEWKIDCLLTGSQKGLMLPPGLALLALSPRAWQRAERIRPGCFYFNLPRERENLEKGQTLFTTPINLIFGLQASLDMIFASGLEALYSKQWALAMLARAGAAAIGLKPLAKEHFAWGVTAICLPDGIDGKKVLDIARKRYGVTMAGGQDKLKGKIIRLGHMGWVDWADCLAGLYALDHALREAGGYSASRDYMEQAMAAYEAALEAGPGNMPPAALIRG